jgi:hypothetical protein
MRIIAFTGPKTCGKDTAWEGLQKLNAQHNMSLFRQQQMAGPAKRIAAEAFGYDPALNDDPALKEVPLSFWPYLCPRRLVIDVANWYRDQYGGEVWARRWEQIADRNSRGVAAHVMTDLRFPEELDMLDRHQSLIIYIDREKSETALRESQEAGDQMARNVSESHYTMLRARANAVVTNNATIEEFHDSIEHVLYNAWGYVTKWSEYYSTNHHATGAAA